MFIFLKKLDENDFGDDEVLGKTEYNIGMLRSDNAHNVVSELVTMKVFFRSTFLSENKIVDYLKSIIDAIRSCRETADRRCAFNRVYRPA